VSAAPFPSGRTLQTGSGAVSWDGGGEFPYLAAGGRLRHPLRRTRRSRRTPNGCSPSGWARPPSRSPPGTSRWSPTRRNGAAYRAGGRRRPAV